MRHLAHACSWRCLAQWKEDRAGTESIFEAAHAPTLSCDAPFNDLQPYYWVVQGIEGGTVDPSLPAGQLLLLAVRVVGTPGIGLGFKVLGTTAIVVSNAAAEPSEWQYRTKDMTSCGAATDCEQWTTAIAPAPPTPDCERCVYLVGQPRGPNTAPAQIIRSPLRNLLDLDFSAVEMLCTDNQWRPRLPDAVRWPHAPMGLFTQQPSTTLLFNSFLNRWIAASTDAFAGKHIVLWSSEGADVGGPWRSDVMYTLPPPFSDASEVFCYAVKLHPHLATSPNEIVSTVMSNAFNMSVLFGDTQQANFGGTQIYTPYVLRTTLVKSDDDRMPPRDYWPTQAWRHASPGSQGLNASALAEASRYLHATNQRGWDKLLPNGTTLPNGSALPNGTWWLSRSMDALLVVRGGRVVHEEYSAQSGKDIPHDVCSATKSIAWMGLAHAANLGKLSLDTNVTDYYPNLKPAKAGDPSLQLKHVMNMDGSLNFTQANSHLDNLSAWTLAKAPGSGFQYSGLNSMLAG